VEALQDKLVSAPGAGAIKSIDEFRAALADMRDAFREWRYLYEKERSSTIRFQPMIFVMQVLHETCRAREEISGPKKEPQ
jgi:hypothetical protein